VRAVGPLDHRGDRARGCVRGRRTAQRRVLHERPAAGRGARRQRGRGARAPPRPHRCEAACRHRPAVPAHRPRHDLQAGSLTVRPDDINVALLVHVLGAMVLVGGLVTAASAALIGWRDEGIALRRFSYKTLLWVAFPGYIVMRVGAQWVEAKENLD